VDPPGRRRAVPAEHLPRPPAGDPHDVDLRHLVGGQLVGEGVAEHVPAYLRADGPAARWCILAIGLAGIWSSPASQQKNCWMVRLGVDDRGMAATPLLSAKRNASTRCRWVALTWPDIPRLARKRSKELEVVEVFLEARAP
jgi:hypothetical protein